MTTYGAVDVHYGPGDTARAGLVIAEDGSFAAITEEHVTEVAHVEPYRPGAFFERELPPIRAVLAGVRPLELLVVDGYVDLDPSGRPGLGAHVHAAGLAPVVVGVAKTPFRSATHALPVARGTTATKPLWVTALGMSRRDAADLVAAMTGQHRVPDALRRVDRLARGKE